MTREEAHSIIKLLVNAYNIGYKDGVEAYKAMMELEKEEKEEDAEDCISRQAVDEYITNLLSGYLYDEERTRLEDLTAFVWELPSVTPKAKTGHWIEKEDCNLDIYYDCSECGESFCLIDGTPTDYLYNYCPNCGARMAESEDKE